MTLRDSQLGPRFRRQQPIGRYVVDFVCRPLRLVIEVDGGQHGGSSDHQRDAFLARQGYAVLRFWNNDVIENLEGVITQIMRSIEAIKADRLLRLSRAEATLGKG